MLFHVQLKRQFCISLWLLSLEGYEQQTSNILQMPYIIKAASFFQKEAVVARENEGVLERSGKQQKAPNNFEWYLRQWMMKRIGRVSILASHLTVCPSLCSSTVVNTGPARSCFLFFFQMIWNVFEWRRGKDKEAPQVNTASSESAGSQMCPKVLSTWIP